MAYQRIGPWQNGIASPPINATNLDRMESGIISAEAQAIAAQSTANGAQTAAGNAQTAANNAKSAADSAQTTANSALANSPNPAHGLIPANTDFNSLTAPGWYTANAGGGSLAQYNLANFPPGASPYGLLEVVASANSIIHRYTDGGPGTQVRQRYDGGWSPWAQLPPITANTVNPITGWYHVDTFGAKGDGNTDDSDAIQAAVNAANTAYAAGAGVQRVYFSDRHYRVTERPFYQSGGNQDGTASIYLKDGVELYGKGYLHVLNNAHGSSSSYYAIVRTRYEGATDVTIDGLTFDGNRGNNPTSQNSGNILIEALSRVTVRNVMSRESPGNGIMVRGNRYGDIAYHIAIENCVVYNITGIGIQASQFNGCSIRNNTVYDTTDNCIDIYGDSGGNDSRAVNWIISGNRVSHGNVGIFPESAAFGTVAGNYIFDCYSEGIHVNRINSEPHDLAITGNTISGCPVGVGGTGDSGHNGVTVKGNTILNSTNGGIRLGGAGNVSYWLIADNTINPASGALHVIASGTQQWAFSLITRTTSIRPPANGDTTNYASTTYRCVYANSDYAPN